MPAAVNWSEPASSAPVEAQWWRTLGDPVLTDLVAVAAAQNLDLLAAQAQIREARANRDVAFGAVLPQADVTAAASRNELSANGELPVNSIPHFGRTFNLFDAGFDASWEIDLWGGNRRSLEAANARAQSALEAARTLRLEVIAEVARTYVELRSAQVRFAHGIGTATISDSQRRPLVLTKWPLEDRTGSR